MKAFLGDIIDNIINHIKNKIYLQVCYLGQEDSTWDKLNYTSFFISVSCVNMMVNHKDQISSDILSAYSPVIQTTLCQLLELSMLEIR